MRSRLLYSVFSAVVASASVALAIFFFSSYEYSGSSGIFLLLASVGSAATLLSVFTFREGSGKRVFPARIALAGPPGAGKTVYANLSSKALSEIGLGSMQFTASTRTTQRVSRVIQALRYDQWPRSTTDDGLTLFQGLLRAPRSLLERLMGGHTDIDLELADSAGELWRELAHGFEVRGYEDASDRGFPLRESSFFEYVANAHAVLYLLPADALLGDPASVKGMVDEFLTLVEILRDLEVRRGSSPKRFGLVVAKADLLSNAEAHLLSQLIESASEFSLELAAEKSGPDLPPGFKQSILQIERFVASGRRNRDTVRVFAVSAIASALSLGTLVPPELEGLKIQLSESLALGTGIIPFSDASNSLRPLEWVVKTSQWV